jgi:hypothetical protein
MEPPRSQQQGGQDTLGRLESEVTGWPRGQAAKEAIAPTAAT